MRLIRTDWQRTFQLCPHLLAFCIFGEFAISLDIPSPHCRNDNMVATHRRRKTAMQMLRRGEITVTEAATIGLVSRQRVREWCQNAGIEPRAARAAWLAQILLRLNKQDGDR